MANPVGRAITEAVRRSTGGNVGYNTVRGRAPGLDAAGTTEGAGGLATTATDGTQVFILDFSALDGPDIML